LLKLSVITPTLNQGKFIERTIKSVLDQGYGDLEYMVVDGGSTDETLEIIGRYEDRIAWWISEPDEGQTDALAKGFERATGDVIAFINSDDYYLPGAFEKAIGALEASGASWVAGAAINVDEHDRPRETPVGPVWVPAPPENLKARTSGRHLLVLEPYVVAQPASFWRRELFERYGGFREDMHFAFDGEFMTRLVMAGEMPALLPDDELAACVLHSDAKSANFDNWDSELKLQRRVHTAELTASERVWLRLTQTARLLWLDRLAFQIRFRVIHPALRLAGRLLDRLPERFRPKIRTRDRRPS
jgi:glycosyltransferase involved in cell wall biosynthesis